MWRASSLPYLSPRSEGQVDPWSEEAAQAGRTGSQKIREAVTETPPVEIALALRLPEGAPAVVRRRTMLMDDRPVELTDSWYPTHVAADTALAEPTKIKGGAVKLLANLGYTVYESREEIEVRGATPQEAEELKVSVGAPVIVLWRTCLTAAEVPFEASVMVMVPEGRRLRYRLIAG